MGGVDRLPAQQRTLALTSGRVVLRGAELRRLRTEAGLPLRLVAEPFDIPVQRLSRIERGLTRDPDLQTRIHTWLTETNMTHIAA